jgi:glucan biosynthesis protein C
MTTHTATSPAQQVGVVKPQRRYDIDWLRIVAVLLLFYVHPAKIFYTYGPWYVQNIKKSEPLSVLTLFMEHWQMQLLFLLAGAATFFALQFRSGREYTKERFKRLLIPYVFGLLVLVPPQLYIEMFGFRGMPYIKFFPKFFDPDFTHGFDMGHLWFIAYLFIFSLVALPLFLFLKRESGRRVIGALASFFSLPGAIYLMILPLMLVDYLLYDFYPNPIYFFTFFLLGYLLLADERFEEAIGKNKLIALLIGIVWFAAWLIAMNQRIRLPLWVGVLTRGVVTWCSLMAIMGYGRRFLNFANQFLNYQSEASYPVYILHQTVVIAIGYFVIRWQIGVLPKFLLIVAGSLLVTFGIYEIFVKRTNVTRFLFGMRPLKRKA